MTESEMKQWNQPEFIHSYLEIADTVIVGRRQSIKILRSFYKHFLLNKKPIKMVDLGCGDGILSHELLQIDRDISATLIDSSPVMLQRARNRLRHFTQTDFVNATFEEILAGSVKLPIVDLAVSALAIHHLTAIERESFFQYIYNNLTEGGFFINLDVVRAPAAANEEWYINLWKEGIEENRPGFTTQPSFEQIFTNYMEENHYSRIDTLENQISMLRSAGFRNVDCFYKLGIFAMYGGRK